MKFSIITVCKNSEQNIEQTIQSVLNQNYSDIEYIIIDGGSKDRTLDVIRKYEKSLAFCCSEPDRGIYNAMNKGLKHATGDVVAFLNSDDWYEDDTLQKVSYYFQNYEIDCLAGEVNSILNDRVIEMKRMQHTEEDIHLSMIYRHPAFFAKRKLFDEIGCFDESYQIAADYDWVLKVHNRGCKIWETNEILSNFRRDGISAVQKYLCMRETKEIAQKNIGEHGEWMRQKIEEAIDLDAAYEETALNLLYIEEPDYLESFFNFSKRLYVWGTGDIGHWCLKVLEKAKITVEGLVDTYRKTEQLGHYRVYFPNQIPKEAFFCIAVDNYRQEIISQIEEMGYSGEQYICFLDVMRCVKQYAKEKYASRVWV